jgi:hypothetical protein
MAYYYVTVCLRILEPHGTPDSDWGADPIDLELE